MAVVGQDEVNISTGVPRRWTGNGETSTTVTQPITRYYLLITDEVVRYLYTNRVVLTTGASVF